MTTIEIRPLQKTDDRKSFTCGNMAATFCMIMSVTLYIGCQQTSAPQPPTAKTIAKPQPSQQQRQTPQPKSKTQPTPKRPATPLFLLEDKLQNAWLKDNKGHFLILVHGKCPGSMGMEKALSLYQKEGSLPIPYKTVQLHQMEKLPIFSTPWLLLVRDGQIVDGQLPISFRTKCSHIARWVA